MKREQFGQYSLKSQLKVKLLTKIVFIYVCIQRTPMSSLCFIVYYVSSLVNASRYRWPDDEDFKTEAFHDGWSSEWEQRLLCCADACKMRCPVNYFACSGQLLLRVHRHLECSPQVIGPAPWIKHTAVAAVVYRTRLADLQDLRDGTIPVRSAVTTYEIYLTEVQVCFMSKRVKQCKHLFEQYSKEMIESDKQNV